MLITSWLRSVQARVQLGTMRRRRVRRDVSKAYTDVRMTEALEDRSLLTALVIDPLSWDGAPITIDNAALGSHDAIVIDSLTIANTLNVPGINIDLDNVALKYITIESTTVTGGNDFGIVINLENITGTVDDIVIDTATVSGNALDAIDIDLNGTNVDDLAIAHSDISGAVDINVLSGVIGRLAAAESSFVATTGASLTTTLNDTTVDTFVISDSTIDGGAVIDGVGAITINHGYIVRNEITGVIGEAGIRMTVADSSVNDFIVAENSKINSVTEDGILVEFSNTPTDGLKILNNTFATDPAVAMDLTIDGDTFSNPFRITNNASAGQQISKVTLDISPTGLVFDVDPTTGLPFNALNGTDTTTGFVNPAAVGTNILTMDFNNFDPSEVFEWEIDVDFLNDPNDLSPVFGDDLIGSIITVEFDDGTTTRTISGLLVADPDSRDAARFAATQSGSGGNGIRLELDKSDQSNLWIDGNTIEGNSGGGIVFNNSDSDVIDGVISNNQINATQADGIAFNLIDSNYSGALLDNTIGGNVGHGVSINPSIAISGDVLDADNTSDILITSIGHGLTTGDTVVIGGVTGNVKANGVYAVTVVTPNTFTLDGVDGTQIGVDTARFAGGGTWFRVASTADGGNVIGASHDPTGATDVVITSTSHGLATGDSVTIAAVLGNLAANGTHTVTVISANEFSLDGVVSTATYEAASISNPGGGYWFRSFTVDFDSAPNRVIRGNNFNTNGMAGLKADLPQGTVFNATLHSNIFDSNNEFGLGITTTAGVFDLNVGSRDLEANGLPTHRNVFQRNVGAGIALQMFDSGSGSYDIVNNSFVGQVADATSTVYDGDGINVRMQGTQGAAAATSLLSTSVIEGNVFGVDSRGNEGSGIDFFMQEDTRIQVLEVRGNSFLNNGDDGFKFFRRDDAVLDQVLIADNTFENNASDGIDLTAINTTIDPLDFVLTDNVITENASFGVRMLLQADARIAADFNNNLIDQNGTGGLDVRAVQQVELELNLDNNQIRNNQGDGVRILGVNGVVNAIVRMNNITDAAAPPLLWQNNVITGNVGDGVDIDNVAFGSFDWINNRFDNNSNTVVNDNVGHGVTIRGATSITINALQNTFSDNNENGLDFGGGFALTLGDGTVPNQNVIEGNDDDGIEVQGNNITVLANQNVIQRNGGDGVDLEVGTYRAEFNDVVFFENGLDGIELEARSGSHNPLNPTGGSNTLLVTNSRITFNGGRGVDILNEGSTGSDVHLRSNAINSNGLSGVYVVNTAATDQVQLGPADEANFSQTGSIFAAPNLDLHVIDNEIQSNGVLTSRGGLVMWVGTAGSNGFIGTGNGFDTVANAIITQLAGAKIRADVQDNQFEGNFGSDVYIQPFRSTVNPPTTTGVWLATATPPYNVTGLARDPLSRIDMVFRGNTGDSLDVTNTAPFYNNAEPVFKSRLGSQNPSGPFNSATRNRNATVTMGNAQPFAGPGAGFGYDGLGVSTFRVETNPDDGPLFFQDTGGFGFSDYDDSVGGTSWGRLPVGSVFTIAADAFDTGGASNDTAATAVNLGTQGQLTIPALNIDNAADEDWFRAFAFMDGPMTAEILFSHALGDLDFEVYDAGDLVNPIASSNSATDDESLALAVTTGQELFFRVFGVGGALNPTYEFNLDLAVTPDILENNDGTLSATFLGTLGSTTMTGLNITDDDYFEFIAGGSTGQVDATFSHAAGDLDVEIYEATDLTTIHASATTTSDNESVTFATVPGDRYFVRVFEKSQQPGVLHSGYDLTVQTTGLVADGFEPNDTLATAINLSGGGVGPLTSINLTANIHTAGNDDWYQFEAGVGGLQPFTILFDHAQGNLGLQVTQTDGTVLAASTGTSGVTNGYESVTVDLTVGTNYLIRVIGTDQNPGYQLLAGDIPRDAFESTGAMQDNDTLATAASFGTFGGTNVTHKIFRDLTLDSAGDNDFYSVTPAADGSLHVRMFFETGLGNLNVEVQNAAGTVLQSGVPGQDREELTVTGVTAGTTYFIRVFGGAGVTHPNYTLDVETSTGGAVINGPVPGNGGGGGAASHTPSADDFIRDLIITENETAGVAMITLPAGTFSLDQNGHGEDLSHFGDLDITDDLIITGAGQGTTIIDASTLQLLDRIFHIHSGVTVSISDLTIIGGDGTNGGAILNEGTLTLTNVTMSGNRGITEGGAIDNAGTLTINNSMFDGNTSAGPGGAIHNSGTLTVTETVFQNNHSITFGGAIYNTGTVTIGNSTIVDNRAISGGGAIYNDAGSVLTITMTEIDTNDAISQGGAILNAGTMTLDTVGASGNTSGSRGGAIFDEGGSTTIISSTLDTNHANSRGGAIYIEATGNVEIFNSTISTNSVSSRGAGIYNSASLATTNATIAANASENRGGGIYADSGSTSLLNTIVATNTAGTVTPNGVDIFGLISSQGTNLIGITDGSSGTGATDLTGTSVAPLDPMLGALGHNPNVFTTDLPTYILTHDLPANSPATDAGSNSVRTTLLNIETPPQDNRESPRFIDGTFDRLVDSTVGRTAIIDIGAVEFFISIPIAVTTATPINAAPNETIILDATLSYHTNPDEVLTWEWDLDNDGQFDDATGSTTTHSFAQFTKGTPNTIRLRVTDENGVEDITTIDIIVDQGNVAPSANAGGPYVLDLGGDLQLDGSGSTDTNIPAGDSIVSYLWDLDGDGQFDDATGVTPLITSAQLAALGLDTLGTYDVSLRVEDCFGLTHDETVSFSLVEIDFGDAAATYGTLLADNGARHTINPVMFLGTSIDSEPDGIPGATATGDDSAGTDDEDGVTFGILETHATNLVAANMTVVASVAGKIDAWIDYNNDGLFDASEHINAGVSYDVAAGSNTLGFSIPVGITTGAKSARIRYSSAGGLSPLGRAADGEVEDYIVNVSTLSNPITPTILRPNSPSTAPNTTDLTPTITWTAHAPNLTHDIVIRDVATMTDVVNISGIGTTNYTPTNDLAPGVYEVIVTAFNRGGIDALPTNPYTFTVTHLTLTGPTGATQDARPEIAWDVVPGTTRHELRVDSLSDGTIGIINEPNLAGNVGTFVPPADLPIGSYQIVLRAYDSNNEPGDFATVINFQVTTPPVITSPIGNSPDSTPTFTWTEIPGAVTYVLVVDNLSTGQVGVINERTLSTNSYTPTTALPVGIYRTTVTAVNTAAETSDPSVSETFVIATAPSFFTPGRRDPDATPTFSWNDIGAASTYQLWVRNLTTGVDQVIYETSLTTASFTAPTDLPLGRYRAWVRATIDATNNIHTSWSAPLNFDITTAPVLEDPALVVYTGLPEFKWNAPLGADSYEIWVTDLSREPTGEFTKIISVVDLQSTTFVPVPNVDPDLSDFNNGLTELGIGRYRYWVRAFNSLDGSYRGDWSIGKTFTVATRPVMDTPTGRIDDATPTLTWTGVAGAETYEVWVDNRTTDTEQVFYQTNVNATSITTTELEVGHHRAWVRGVNAAGNKSAWSRHIDFFVAASPDILGPIGSSFDRTPVISWTPIAGAAQYDLWLNNTTDGVPQLIRETNLTGTSFAPSTPLPDGDFTVWVRAINASGEAGDWSDPQVFTVGGRPTLAPIATSSVTTPTFTWQSIGQANSYTLQVNQIGGDSRVIYETNLTNTSYTSAVNLAPGQYRAWVRAISVTGETSPWSVEINFTIVAASQPAFGPVAPGFDADTLVPTDQYEILPTGHSSNEVQIVGNQTIVSDNVILTAAVDGDVDMTKTHSTLTSPVPSIEMIAIPVIDEIAVDEDLDSVLASLASGDWWMEADETEEVAPVDKRALAAGLMAITPFSIRKGKRRDRKNDE